MEKKLEVALYALKAIAGGEYETNPFIKSKAEEARSIATQALEAIIQGGPLLESFVSPSK